MIKSACKIEGIIDTTVRYIKRRADATEGAPS